MEMSICFSWALDLYIINFRLCLAVVPARWTKKEKWYNGVGYVMTFIIWNVWLWFILLVTA